MLHPFVSSWPTTSRGPGSAAVSLVVHVALITAAVAAGGRMTHVREAGGTVEERLFDVTLSAPRAKGAARRTGFNGERPRAASVALARLARLTSSITPIGLPTDLTAIVPATEVGPDYASIASAGIGEGGNGLADVIASLIGNAYARAESNGAYAEDVVERRVWPRRGNPVPEYPYQLLRQGMEASLFVTFVVDSTGRVARNSIAFPEQAQTLFVDAIRRALTRSRYDPAEIGGRRVAQLVRQQFRFVLKR